jgi:hypothetical protein
MKTIFEIQAQNIFTDLQDDFQNYLEINGIEFCQWEEIGNGQWESQVKPLYQEIFDSHKDMVLEMGFETFEDWFMTYYELENKNKWIEDWSKAMAKNVEETLIEMEK